MGKQQPEVLGEAIKLYFLWMSFALFERLDDNNNIRS